MSDLGHHIAESLAVVDGPATLDDVLAELRAIRTALEAIQRSRPQRRAA